MLEILSTVDSELLTSTALTDDYFENWKTAKHLINARINNIIHNLKWDKYDPKWYLAKNITNFIYEAFEWLDISYSPILELVINRLTSYKFRPEHKMEIMRIVKFIENGKSTDGQEFLRKMKQTDEFRKETMLTTHREIAEAMGYT